METLFESERIRVDFNEKTPLARGKTAPRIQIFFDATASAAAHRELNGHCWNWSSTCGAWCRKPTFKACESAKKILEIVCGGGDFSALDALEARLAEEKYSRGGTESAEIPVESDDFCEKSAEDGENRAKNCGNSEKTEEFPPQNAESPGENSEIPQGGGDADEIPPELGENPGETDEITSAVPQCCENRSEEPPEFLDGAFFEGLALPEIDISDRLGEARILSKAEIEGGADFGIDVDEKWAADRRFCLPFAQEDGEIWHFLCKRRGGDFAAFRCSLRQIAALADFLRKKREIESGERTLIFAPAEESGQFAEFLAFQKKYCKSESQILSAKGAIFELYRQVARSDGGQT